MPALKLLAVLAAVVCGAGTAYALSEHESIAVDGAGSSSCHTISFMLWGALVMWMCAGFTMLESGSVRTKNASMICLKNIGLYSIAGIAYYLIGYNLMYVDVGSYIGSFSIGYGPTTDEVALVNGTESAAAEVIALGYSTMSDWFFQMVFVATAASIVSGALAERVKIWSFFIFVLVLTGVIYPVVGAWTWGEGWLSQLGFKDFAGSHHRPQHGRLGGPGRPDRRRAQGSANTAQDGSVKPTPPSNVLVVTLGVFILWLGWFGFNGGSQLALGSPLDAVAMSHVLVNTNLAAAAGALMALFCARPVFGRTDLFRLPERRHRGPGLDHRWVPTWSSTTGPSSSGRSAASSARSA